MVRTRAEPLGIDVVVGEPEPDLGAEGVFGVLLQYPGTTGGIRDDRELVANLHAQGTLVAVASDLLALVLLAPPGEWGADVVVGSAQRFGVPMGYGGPHAGFFATREDYKRNLPGRLVGVSVDTAGRPALRLALQTREQHIRREKATSNICTAQVLLANIAGMYAVYHGPDGLRAIADRVHGLGVGPRRVAARRRARARSSTRSPCGSPTRTTSSRGPAPPGSTCAASPTTPSASPSTRPRRRRSSTRVREVFGVTAPADDPPAALPAALRRASAILVHPVFRTYHSESQMLRYLRTLADRDLALDRTMIPLGSCTMKLNATVEMMPITWPEFADIHPFAPADQAEGYAELFAELEAALCEITGYDAVSLQPNAGSQGEFAGLLAIRGYHRSRGQEARTVCLIPESAHGTNAASAVMAGMRVVVVKCDDDGNVDFDDLKAKAHEHAADLAALMVTYPSTHGVYESNIRDVCAVVHECGGQVYLDGANLNALVGLAKPGTFGADVSHLNLHKTFCIPHGGGGPGVGPVAVREHLTPFLSPHIAAAPHGSAGILPISYAYVRLMGGDGLLRATEIAILTANYVATRLRAALPGALQRARRRRRARVHPRPAPDHAGHRGHRRRRHQAADRLRLPRADGVVPGGGHADGGAHRVGGPRRARPLLRRDDRHPRRDPSGGSGGVAGGGESRCGRRRIRPSTWWSNEWTRAYTPRAGRVPGRTPPHGARQVLAAGEPHRRRVR